MTITRCEELRREGEGAGWSRGGGGAGTWGGKIRGGPFVSHLAEAERLLDGRHEHRRLGDEDDAAQRERATRQLGR